MCIGGMLFVEVSEFAAMLASFQKYLKNRFKLQIFIYFMLERKRNFKIFCMCKTCSNKRFVI